MTVQLNLISYGVILMSHSADTSLSNRLEMSLKAEGGQEEILVGSDFYPSGDEAGAWVTVYFGGADQLIVRTKGLLKPGPYQVGIGDEYPVRIFFNHHGSNGAGVGAGYGYEGSGFMVIDEYVMDPPRLLIKGSFDVSLLDHQTHEKKWRAQSDNFRFSKGLGNY
jgi:hypothetical protein